MTKYIANPVEINAYKIVSVKDSWESIPGDGSLGLPVALDNGTNEYVTESMCSRYTPVVGDYWVMQYDGYVYLNPAAIFERKYSPLAEQQAA